MRRDRKTFESVAGASLFRQNRLKSVALLMIFVSALLIGGFGAFTKFSKQQKIQNARALYGTYQIQVTKLDIPKAEKLAGESGVKKSSLFYENLFPEENMLFVYIDEDIFNLYNIKLAKGRMPKEKNEVLCEGKYLYQLGDEFSEGKEIEIDLMGEKYRVVGTVETDSYTKTIYEIYTPKFFFNRAFYASPDGLCTFVAETNSQNGMAGFIAENGLNADNISYNWNVCAFAHVDQNGNLEGIFKYAAAALLLVLNLLLFMLLCTVLSFLSGKLRSTCYIYRALGISRKKLVSIYLKKLTLLLSVGSAAAFVLVYAVNIALMALYGVDYNLLSTAAFTFLNLLAFDLLAAAVAAAGFRKTLSRGVAASVGNPADVRTRKKGGLKSVLLRAKMPFLAIAKRDIDTHRAKFYLSMFLLVAGMVMFSSVSYITGFLFDDGQYAAKHDYRIDFQYDSFPEMSSGTDEIRSVCEKIKNGTALFDVTPIYYLPYYARIDSEELSEKYVGYLKEISIEIKTALLLKKNADLDVSTMIIGADGEALEKVYGISGTELADGECIASDMTNSVKGGTFAAGLEAGDKLAVDYVETPEDPNALADRQSQELTVVKTVKSLELGLEGTYNMPVIVVNMALFEKLGLKPDYPELIYLDKTGGTDAEIKEYFRGVKGIALTDLKTEAKAAREEKTVVLTSVYGVYSILALLIITNIGTAVYIKYDGKKKQLAMLKAIGVRKEKLLTVIGYDFGATAVGAAVYGTVLSAAAVWAEYYYIRCSAKVYFRFTLPVWDVLAPLILLLAFLCAFAAPLSKKIGAMKTIEVLQRGE